MGERIIQATPEHEVFYQDLVALLRKFDHLKAHEILSIAANMLGKIIAMQDQRTMSPDMAMKIVCKNLEVGNAQVIEQLTLKTGGSA